METQEEVAREAIEAEARVERGAALLDYVAPTWADEILLERLDISCPFYCVLGQLYGDYAQGTSELAMGPQGQARHGFISDLRRSNPAGVSNAELQMAWVNEINERR